MVEDTKMALFVTCATALEPLLMDELCQLGIEPRCLQAGYRGVYVYEWKWSTVYKINYASRLASRVLLPLSRFKCYGKESLYKGASLIDWSRYIKIPCSIAIDANVSHRELRNSLFAAQVVKDAICDQLRNKTGRRPTINVQEPDVQLNLYIQNDTAVISFDTSGAPLHKRGYRQESVEAPLKETLAAAILHLSRFSAESIMLDPCCGSGTLLTEAALIATSTPPGYIRRKWGFMSHPDYNQIDWLHEKNALDKERIDLPSGRLFGMDINREAVRICKVNLRAAGFADKVEVHQDDFRNTVSPIKPTIIIANPPYGKRMEDIERLGSLYKDLGDFLKRYCVKPGFGYIFTGNLDLAKQIGLAASRRYVLSNGAIDARLLEFEIY